MRESSGKVSVLIPKFCGDKIEAQIRKCGYFVKSVIVAENNLGVEKARKCDFGICKDIISASKSGVNFGNRHVIHIKH